MPARFGKKAIRAVVIAAASSTVLGFAPAIAALPGAIIAAPGVIDVPCSTAALLSAIALAPGEAILQLATMCTYTLVKGLTINDALVFRGPATFARSSAGGTPRFSIITVGATGDVVTENVSFANGMASADAVDGGAINNAGQLWVNSGVFSGNGTQAYGGAIYNTGQLTVNDTEFTGNFAGYGGAIANFGTASVTKGQFSSNRAAHSGGAAYDHGIADVESSTFTDNSALKGGAAYDRSGTLTLDGTTFSGNGARYGGAVGNEHGIRLSQDSFDSNGSYDTYKGGAVYNDGNATMTDSTLSGNHAKAGGGFYNDATATLTGDTVDANMTAGDGGGIYNFDQLTVSDAKIHGNHAGLDGGGLLNGGFARISGSQIYLNDAGIGGGGIHDYYKLTLTKTSLSNNAPDNCESRLGAAGCVR